LIIYLIKVKDKFILSYALDKGIAILKEATPDVTILYWPCIVVVEMLILTEVCD